MSIPTQITYLELWMKMQFKLYAMVVFNGVSAERDTLTIVWVRELRKQHMELGVMISRLEEIEQR
jgi:hypothetical protein